MSRGPRAGRGVVGVGVIHRRHGAVRPADPEAALAQDLESLRRRDLVDEVQVDVERGGGRGRLRSDDVGVPNLGEERPLTAQDAASFVTLSERSRKTHSS